MTNLMQCPACQRGFLVPPDPCPVCGAPAPVGVPDSSAGDQVVSSRLNRTAQLGGVMIAGILAATLSWFLVSRETGALTLLLALLISAALLWKR
jgi:hypothetical protein